VTKPITPDEASDESNIDHLDYSVVIARINRHLRTGGRTFMRSSISPDMLPKIMREYEGAGWEIELVYDWRDGDYLAFRRRP
jgi:hypothetical protein